MFFVTPVMVKSELRGDLWQRCHLIGACVGARRATSPMKVTVEVGAASSSACLGVDCLGSLGFRCRLRRGSRWRMSKVKSESLSRGGVTTMTLDDILNGSFSSMASVLRVGSQVGGC
ncbi:hypothetical protein QYE76_036077 [Lolium multiflorum]|uniref:Uncharacterized protein n=1 Tax=Lolium multiflorum TaxID=4521 RepID=A0AAD8R3S8_LOLMU|nr:hypothetical protein QYE76_036077 [Lolium multiflorum]